MRVWIDDRKRNGEKRYYLTVDLGDQEGRRCLKGCAGIVWRDEGLNACPKCGGDLGEPTRERRRLSRGSFKKEKEANAARRAIESEFEERGRFVAPKKTAFETFLRDEWLPALRTEVRANTFHSYERIVSTYVVRHLGSVMLHELSPPHLKRLYADLLKSGGRNGKALSPRTVAYVHTVIRRALQDACDWERISQNVARSVRRPKQTKQKEASLRAEELKRLLDEARDHPFYPPLLVGATSGMRTGEILGLRWEDVDLDSGRVVVRHSLVVVDRKGDRLEYGPTKTERERSIKLPPETVKALKAQKLVTGRHSLVFCWADGSPISPESFADALAVFVKKAGVRRITARGLRHTFATLALQAGIHPKIVSEILGHANIGITLDIYSHSIPALEEEATSKVAAMIFNRP